MRQLSSTILKSRSFQKIIMTTQTSSKKSIIQVTNHLKQLAQNNGLASLSSPQVGNQKSMFVMLSKQYLKPYKFNNYKSKSTQYESFINPRILDLSINQVEGWEECSSYPNIKFNIKRSTHVICQYEKTFKDKVRYKQQFKGFESVLIQHEVNHLKCINLFDIAEKIELINDKNLYTNGQVQKLKELFDKFKKQRDQQYKIEQQKQKQKQKNNKRQESQQQKGNGQQDSQQDLKLKFSYINYKQLRDFIDYEIINFV